MNWSVLASYKCTAFLKRIIALRFNIVNHKFSSTGNYPGITQPKCENKNKKVNDHQSCKAGTCGFGSKEHCIFILFETQVVHKKFELVLLPPEHINTKSQ